MVDTKVVGGVGGGMGVSWGATHRSGKCQRCHVKFVDVETGKDDEFGPETYKACPKCGDGQGELISQQVSFTPPSAPTCLRAGCMIRYIRDALFYALVVSYHARRTAYAEANRNKVILERYRTGEPSPLTIWQAIHANLKLKCPVCRKYNVDPLLRRST